MLSCSTPLHPGFRRRQVTGYYAHGNRLADGLGVELEGFWSEA